MPATPQNSLFLVVHAPHLASKTHLGTEERTKYVVEGYEGVVSDLGQDNATCLSGAV
jgi:hypothetical protein